MPVHGQDSFATNRPSTSSTFNSPGHPPGAVFMNGAGLRGCAGVGEYAFCSAPDVGAHVAGFVRIRLPRPAERSEFSQIPLHGCDFATRRSPRHIVLHSGNAVPFCMVGFNSGISHLPPPG